jgi:glycosyltransferase involved in cell wall biosynthesis
MSVSIALCTFNGSCYLSDQLFSISQQTRLPDEVVICDGCSQDETSNVIKAFAQTIPFGVHFHKNDTNNGNCRLNR